MSIQKSFLCDLCGKTRGESNRWFIATVSEDGTTYISQAFHSATPEEIEQADFHLCGEGCATKKYSEFLTKANL
ncbi:MAG TPA: hypothetical protein VFS68_11625 [Candidatus Udaeobacter sp.]|nr:hypothetical protein [Candidatus Udaeobacter sp.]